MNHGGELMANTTNDDMDRIGNRNTPPGSSNQGRSPGESFNRATSDRGPGSSGRESETRWDELERDKSGRGPSDISE